MKNILKINLALFLLLGSFISLNAQSVSLPEATITPAPLDLLENNGTGIGCFTFVESSGIDVPAESFPGMANVSMSMNLQFVALTNNDISGINGTLLEYFTPSYNPGANIITFTQNQMIPADLNASVCIDLTVTQNSSQAQAFNGFNVNISATDGSTNAEGNAGIFTFTTNLSDDDGDGVLNVDEPDTALDPCLPAQNPGYTGYNQNNLNWQQSDCDGDLLSNATEVMLGSDPYSAQNTILGKVSIDLDGNGCDTNDAPYAFMNIEINDGTTTSSILTNETGQYDIYTEAGDFTVTPTFENPSYFNVDPANVTVNFADANSNFAIQDFCVTPNGVHNDVEILIAPINAAKPGFDAEYVITYKNKGNQTLSGDYSMTYDETVLDFVSATVVPAQASGLLTWDYVDLLPFQTRTVNVTLSVNSPTDTPAVNLGDQLDFSVAINPVAGDELPEDNQLDYNQTVVSSFDPNNIICLEGEFEDNTAIGNYLHYIVNFENTGDISAQNIIVVTDVDPTMYDISTLQVLNSTHTPITIIEDNQVLVIFDAINLDAGAQGNVVFKLKTLEDLDENSTVTQNAEIFFDFNFPIETNDANTTFQTLLGNAEFNADTAISLYPNPTSNVVTVAALNTITNVSIIDIQGRTLQSIDTNVNELDIDVSSRANGVYFIKIATDNGTYMKKVIKE